MTLQARILSAWMSSLRLEYIAHVENISVAEVEATIAKYSKTWRFGL